MTFRLLGSGGWLPTSTRLTSCLYARDGADALVVDAGAGAGRLFEEPALLDGVERLHVLLTHWHLDHAWGLGFLSLLPSRPELHLVAPGEEVMGQPVVALLRRLLGPPFLTTTEAAVDGLFTSVREAGEGTLEIGPFTVRTRVQRLHGSPSLGLRIGDVAYVTDTAYDEATAAFVRGAGLLLHEAVHASSGTSDPVHSAAGEAAALARDAGVGRLVLIHLDPGLDDEEELLRHARAVFPRVEAGRDGPLAVPG